MKILVTGATGFIGSHVVQQLQRAGHDLVLCHREGKSSWKLFDSVAKVYSQKTTTTGENSHHDSGMVKLKALLTEDAERLSPYIFVDSEVQLNDVFDKLSVELIDFDEVLETVGSQKFDAVVHCAAIISFHPKDRARMLKDNVEGTRNLVNACLRHGVEHFYQISSIAALGRPLEDGPITLETPWEENSPYNTDYALSKYYAELEVWRGKEEGLKVKLFYPGVVLGEGEGHTSSKQVIDVVKNGNPFYPVGSNGFVFVEDLAKKITDELESSGGDERFLCVSHNLSFQKLIQSVADAYGYKGAKWPLKGVVYSAVYGVARFCEWVGIKIPITTELMRSTSKVSVYKD
jgi:nucleoside-diphosphate-sugar epimerase